MAKRQSNRSRKYAGKVTVDMSTGYTLVLDRPTLREIEALNLKAEEEFPMPPRPTEKVKSVTGEIEVPLADGAPEVEEWKQKCSEVEAERYGHLLDYALTELVEVAGYEGKDGHDKLVEKLRARKERLLKWGKLDEKVAELDEFQQVLQLFIIGTADDWQALTFAVLSAMDADIDEDSIRRKVQFFPGDVAR